MIAQGKFQNAHCSNTSDYPVSRNGRHRDECGASRGCRASISSTLKVGRSPAHLARFSGRPWGADASQERNAAYPSCAHVPISDAAARRIGTCSGRACARVVGAKDRPILAVRIEADYRRLPLCISLMPSHGGDARPNDHSHFYCIAHSLWILGQTCQVSET